MKEFYVLGVDQSTQGTKAVLLNSKGEIVKKSYISHKQIITPEGWVCHNPEEIYKNVILACKNVITDKDICSEQILCMGISNQRETTVMWDKVTGKSLTDANVWQCNRASSICEKVTEVEEKIIYEKTGLKLSPLYPAAKMAWFLENVRNIKLQLAENKVTLGTIDSWLVYKLSKEKNIKTDISNASRTQLFNIHTLKWDEELCQIFGVNKEMLAEVVDSDSIFGYTDLEGVLDNVIPINAVLGDSHAALFAHNCVNKGDMKVTYGTGSSVMLNCGQYSIFSKHGLSTSICWKIKGNIMYCLEGNISYTGAVITWLKDELQLIDSASQSEKLALNANQDDTTYIVPAFTGLGAPYWNSEVKASITGMSRTTGKNEIVRAACDSIAYQISDILESLEQDIDNKILEIYVDGGPTKNNYIMQFQSDIADVLIQIPEIDELSLMGVSFLAGMTVGCWNKDIYNIIKYKKYVPQMKSSLRRTKKEGWKSAINMLILK